MPFTDRLWLIWQQLREIAEDLLTLVLVAMVMLLLVGLTLG